MKRWHSTYTELRCISHLFFETSAKKNHTIQWSLIRFRFQFPDFNVIVEMHWPFAFMLCLVQVHGIRVIKGIVANLCFSSFLLYVCGFIIFFVCFISVKKVFRKKNTLLLIKSIVRNDLVIYCKYISEIVNIPKYQNFL